MDKKHRAKMPREVIMLDIIFIALLVIVLRLGYIQLILCDEYSQKAVSQRILKVPLKINRGDILDRNHISFTNREKEIKLIAYTSLIKDWNKAVEIIKKATGDRETEIESALAKGNIVEFDIKNESDILTQYDECYGLVTTTKYARYEKNGLLRHFIGRLDNENGGEIGIEKKFDSYLRGDGIENAISIIDSNNNMVQGIGISSTKSVTNSLVTTVDYLIQQKAEEVMDRHLIDGAVVIKDINTGEILAMASRPNFRQNKNQLLLDTEPNYINKGGSSYNLGSVFKIITLAAAIENNRLDLNKVYTCEGGIQVSDVYVKCSAGENHHNKPISAEEAFAVSCNSAFIQIAQDTGAENIIDMAGKFGIGKKQLTIVDNKNIINPINESSGKLPDINDGITNIAIGQGSIMATPIQVAEIISIIARDGIKKPCKIIKSVIGEDGKIIKEFETEPEARIISTQTAKIIQGMMYKVTVDGSGVKANMDEALKSAGKTGTAEAGEYTHAWFAGYYPYEHPRLAISVFIFDGQSGGGKAAPIFKEILNELSH